MDSANTFSKYYNTKNKDSPLKKANLQLEYFVRKNQKFNVQTIKTFVNTSNKESKMTTPFMTAKDRKNGGEKKFNFNQNLDQKDNSPLKASFNSNLLTIKEEDYDAANRNNMSKRSIISKMFTYIISRNF